LDRVASNVTATEHIYLENWPALLTLLRVKGCLSVITGRPARSAAMPVLFLLTGPKIPFQFLVWSLLRDKHPSYKHFVCFFVTLWNDEVCDNGNDMKQYNFQNNYGVIA